MKNIARSSCDKIKVLIENKLSYFNLMVSKSLDTVDSVLEQKRVVSKFALDFDKLINLGKENKIDEIINNYNSNPKLDNSVTVNNIFFIWIGSINSRALEYIDIWNYSFKSGDITIYYDSQYLLFNSYSYLFERIYRITDITSIADIIKYQSDFKKNIDVKIASGLSFDEAIIFEAEKFSSECATKLKSKLILSRIKLSLIGKKYNLIDVSNSTDIFFDSFLYKMYVQELTLRANAAAAADILRLLILYSKGGMYVDVDTLPSLTSIYGTIASAENANIVNIVRSEYYLRKWRDYNGLDCKRNLDVSRLEECLNTEDPNIMSGILKSISSLRDTTDLTLPIPVINVHKDLISVAAFERLYEYNNNVLIAAKGSKLIRIIIKEIKLRYRFIINHGYDIGSNNQVSKEHHLYRLSRYRYDALDGEDNVTLFLTGPSLILEVLLGAAYEVLSLDKEISPLALSYSLRLKCVAIAFTDHTCYTPEHVMSSWM